MSEVLIDTTGLWGLIFKDSKYHEFMTKLAETKMFIVPSPQLLELLIVAYKETSNKGREFKKGISMIKTIYEFLSEENKLKAMGINLKYHPVGSKEILEAIKLILSEDEIFIKEMDERKWIEFIDAVTASIWMKTRRKLYTRDEKLMKFGEKHNLKFEVILPSKRSK